MRILIIEDQVSYANLLKTFLLSVARPENIKIVDCLEDAIKEIQSAPLFEIITLDLNLRTTRHEETLKRIKEIKKINGGGILIVISGIIDSKDTHIMERYGADAVLAKISVQSKDGFTATFRDIIKSIVKVPQRYQRNIALLGNLAEQLSKPDNESRRA